MFEKLLVANRGEIACRIARTARRMGVKTIAVYSEADADALHVELSDEAWPIGPPPARESYLNIEKLIEVALRSGAQAVHPGYGFLAENPQFAERCLEAGLIFIGPSPQAIRIMGSKALAKSLMESAGAPVVPGYHGEACDVEALVDAAHRIGFPLIVKASAGGGGRGMRIVRSPDLLPGAIASAEREALASFGDGRLLLEKYLENPRHIEVQVFGDAKGEFVTFFERDCSLQRRHQKIIEETPAPHLPSSLARKMRETAIVAARAIGYAGAGTVEFLVQDGSFYFLEMNARLQVEHPVTEMVAGQDLVEWQLRIACGESLPLSRESLTMQGCAVEVRICAEDPAKEFMPSVGVIEHFLLPPQCDAVRVDAGVRRGDRITQYYDSLLAKLIVWGADRQEMVRRLKAALASFEAVGVATNLDFLRAIANDAHFQNGNYDTEFVARQLDTLMLASQKKLDRVTIVAAGAAEWLDETQSRKRKIKGRSGDGTSPWAMADGWRLLQSASQELRFMADGEELITRIYPQSADSFRLEFDKESVRVRFKKAGDRLSLETDGVKREFGIVCRASGLVVIFDGKNHYLEFVDPLKPAIEERDENVQLRAPLPGRIIRVYARVGDRVKKGAHLIALEAMKMEITLVAPRDGVVERIFCAEGEMTSEGAELILFAEGDS